MILGKGGVLGMISGARGGWRDLWNFRVGLKIWEGDGGEEG